MAKLPTELEAGSPYYMWVNDIDSVVRFSWVIIEKAKNAIELIEKGDWEGAEKEILQILRVLNQNNLNFKHIRQMIHPGL